MFGVYAAGVRDIDVSGTVLFTAKNVNATVEVSDGIGEDEEAASVLTPIAWGDEESNPGSLTLQTFSTAVAGGAAAQQLGKDVLLVQSGDLDDDNLVYVYTITVTNTSTNAPMHVKFVVNDAADATGISKVIVVENNEEVVAQGTAYDGYEDITVAAGDVVVFTATYTVNPELATTGATYAIGASVNLGSTSDFLAD